MNHCIIRAKERYGLELTELDIVIIELLIDQGLAKPQTPLMNKYGEIQKDRLFYHLRYGGKLIYPVTNRSNGAIITFLPTGKGNSSKKYYEKRIDQNQINMIKRLNRK